MMTSDLSTFIIKAKKSTYASATGDSKKILSDGSKEFLYSEDEFVYRDRYYGSSLFVGEEAVFFNDKAVWAMNYYGTILDRATDEKEVYGFLKKALVAVTEDAPFRGPSELTLGDYTYKSEFIGDLNSFSGIEEIYLKNRKLYELHFHGGAIA